MISASIMNYFMILALLDEYIKLELLTIVGT